jgi:hypothetical protein
MNITNLKADVDFLCGSTSATYSDTNKIRNINIAYLDVARTIWESDSVHFDDANNTDSMVAYKGMANASASYLVPTTAIRINGVEVADANGDWKKLKFLNVDDLTVSREEYLTGTGTPLYYNIEGTQCRLFPAPGTGYVTMSSGLAFRLSRNVTEFATTATTTEPGFPANFHRILSYAAAMDFTQDEKQRQYLAGQKERLEQGMRRYYAKSVQEAKTIIRPAGKKRWRQYV